MKIPIVLNETAWNYGMMEYVIIDFDISPMGAVVGATGSGKSYCVKNIASKCVMFDDTCILFVLDYKGSTDFDYLEGIGARYYAFDKVHEGIQELWECLSRRQNKKDNTAYRIVAIIDEFAAYTNYMTGIDKKLAEADKQIISNIGMLGRSFKINLILSQQRFDSSYWGSGGGRENFISSGFVILLGNASQESQKMLFPEYYTNLSNDRKRGTGYMSICGNDVIPIISPVVNMERANKLIKIGATR